MPGIHIHSSRTFHPVAVMLAGVFLALPVVSAEQPDPKSDAKISPGELREYLPSLLQKASLEIEREYLTALEMTLKLQRALWQGGAVGAREVNEVELEVLQTRIRVREQEASFLASVDRLQLRFGAAHERLQKVDEAIRLPLVRHLKKFEDLSTDFHAAQAELQKHSTLEETPKLRPLIRRFLTASALVKDTTFGKGIANRWASWERSSADDLESRLRQHKNDRSKLEGMRSELESKGQALSEANQARLQEADLEVLLGRLERELRTYESQPWKGGRNPDRRHQLVFGSLESAFVMLLSQGRLERLEEIRKSWPALPQVLIQGADLLADDMKSAELRVAALLKKPEAVATATGTLRELRALAEVYRLQQRVVELSFANMEIAHAELKSQEKMGDLVAQILTPLRRIQQAKGKLLHTWIAFHVTRLNLYRDLELTPP